MTTEYVLKRGARIRAEDLIEVDSPEKGTRVTVLKHPKDTQQGQLDLQPKKRKPWADAHPQLTQPFNLRLSQALHLKLKHCTTIVPGVGSMQKIAIKAIEDRVAELLAQYDKD